MISCAVRFDVYKFMRLYYIVNSKPRSLTVLKVVANPVYVARISNAFTPIRDFSI